MPGKVSSLLQEDTTKVSWW